MSHMFLARLVGDDVGQRWTQVGLERLPESCHEDVTIAECIADELSHSYGETVTIDRYRTFTKKRQIGTTTIRVVRLGRAYGGPEEGGWYYTYEELLREFIVPNAMVEKLQRRLRAYEARKNEGMRTHDVEDRICVRLGAWKPMRRPHYC